MLSELQHNLASWGCWEKNGENRRIFEENAKEIPIRSNVFRVIHEMAEFFLPNSRI